MRVGMSCDSLFCLLVLHGGHMQDGSSSLSTRPLKEGPVLMTNARQSKVLVVFVLVFKMC